MTLTSLGNSFSCNHCNRLQTVLSQSKVCSSSWALSIFTNPIMPSVMDKHAVPHSSLPPKPIDSMTKFPKTSPSPTLSSPLSTHSSFSSPSTWSSQLSWSPPSATSSLLIHFFVASILCVSNTTSCLLRNQLTASNEMASSLEVILMKAHSLDFLFPPAFGESDQHCWG